MSNNPYALDNPLAPGTRPAFDTGRLGIVVLGVPGGTSLRPGRAWTAPRLSAVAGGLLGLLRLRERHPERVDEASVDQLAEACLRLLGVPASEAARLAASSLPPVGAQ